MSQEQSSAQELTGAQIVEFVSSAIYNIAAPSVARDALLSGLKAAGISHPDTIAAVTKAEKSSFPKGAPANGQGKKKPGPKPKNAEGGDEEKAKKKRAPSGMNIYMSYVYDAVAKDSNNPAYQPAEPVDANGKPVKMPNIQFVTTCWKAMPEADKTRFNEMVQTFLATRGEADAQDGHQAKPLEQFLGYLKEHQQEKEMLHIHHRAVEAGTGVNPGKPGKGATPAKPAATTAAAPASEKRKADKAGETPAAKKAKAAEEEAKSDKKEDKKKKKKDKDAKKAAEEEKKRKEAEEEARKKAAQKKKKQSSSSSSDSSSSDSDSD